MVEIVNKQCNMCKREIKANWMEWMSKAAIEAGYQRWQEIPNIELPNYWHKYNELHGAPTVPCVNLCVDYEEHYYCKKHVQEMLNAFD